MAEHILAIDQGTTSSRAIVFDRSARIVASASREHRQYLPAPGQVEHDPAEILDSVEWAMGRALETAGLTTSDVAAIGITNQRETAIVWDRATGEPVSRAIVWQDTRTQDLVDAASERGGQRIAALSGLPAATYFSASKIAWILDRQPTLRSRAEAGSLAFGTVDSWLVWHLTGGPEGGQHVTDVTNASRTALMDLTTLDWSDELLGIWGVPRALLPRIVSSSEVVAVGRGRGIEGVPIAGILGDQQAASFGQTAFDAGESKNTYGTGNFLLVGTGETIARSRHGLISTVAYRCAGEPARYAMEGSIAVTGSLVQWLRDNLGIIERAEQVETLAAQVPDNGDVYVVPAFSGLYAPYWRPDARGAVVGLTRFATAAHLARASLEATAYQSADVIEAAVADSGAPIPELRVDGGMTRNDLLMQFQADILGIPVVRPEIVETTALGAAFAAGLAVGVWSDREELRSLWRADAVFEPRMSADRRAALLARWHRAVERSFDWVESPDPTQ